MKILIYITAVVTLVFIGCKKKEKVETCESGSTDGTCSFELRHMAGPATFAFNTDYMDDFGNQFQFTRADWYLKIDGILEHDMVTPTTTEDHFAKIDPSVLEVDYINVPAGSIHNLAWGLGVDSAYNHLDVSTYPAGNALGHQSPSMHWGWSSGYIFCVMEGRVDIDGSGSYDSGETFALHVGMDTNYRLGSPLHIDATVPESGNVVVNLDVDYLEFIDSIDLSIDNSTHTMDNMPLAVRVADNFPKVLKLQ